MSAIPVSARKELFHLGYLQTLIAPVGIEILKAEVTDYDKVDCLLKCPGEAMPNDITTGAIIQVQLKATSSPSFIESNTMLSFPMEKKFCRLVHREQANWRFLFVLHCPTAENTWASLNIENEHLVLQHVMYWAGLRDIPEPGPNEDMNSTKNIRIPRTQIVNSDSLKAMLSAQANRDLNILYNEGGNT